MRIKRDKSRSILTTDIMKIEVDREKVEKKLKRSDLNKQEIERGKYGKTDDRKRYRWIDEKYGGINMPYPFLS